MRYRLKDRELQKKLDEISGGAFLFGKALNEACQDIKSFDPKYCPPIQVKFGQTPGLTHAYEVYFNPDQIERCKEYDPYAWNSYPEVTPPEGVWMRCERPNDLCADGIERMCMKWMVDEQGGFWTDDCESGDFDYENLRFRPWED